jgi:hypothetical protein
VVDSVPLLVVLLALHHLPQLDLQLVVVLIPPVRLEQPHHLLLAILDLPPDQQLVVIGDF